MDAGKKFIQNIVVLTAIRCTVEDPDGCPGDFIQNCFTHCFRQGDDLRGYIENEVETAIKEHIQRDAHEHRVTTTRAGIQNLLNPEGEVNVLEQIIYDH